MLIHTSRPDITKIKRMVKSAIDPKPAAKGTKKPAQHPGTSTPVKSNGTTGGAIGSLKSGYAANQANDLGSAC